MTSGPIGTADAAMTVLELRDFNAQLVLVERPRPEPAPGEVLVEVVAAGLSYVDRLVTSGKYQSLPALPLVPGMELAGTVTAVGTGVVDLSIGDRVLAQVRSGAWAGYVCVPELAAVRIPDRMAFAQAATFGLAHATAYAALVDRARVQPGETVLVSGANGAVGRAACSIARALGATVIALVRPRVDALPEIPAADCVLACEPHAIKDEVHRATGGEGADVVIDQVGGDTLGQLVRATAWEGRVVLVGFASGEQPLLKPGHLLVKNIAVAGLQTSDYFERRPAQSRQMLATLLRLWEEGRLDVGEPPTLRAVDVLADDPVCPGPVAVLFGTDS